MTRARIYYARVDEFWRKEQKYAYLEAAGHVGGVEWQELQPDARHNWLTEGMRDEFETFIPVGSKEGKSAKAGGLKRYLAPSVTGSSRTTTLTSSTSTKTL